ncbi:disintegrin and metalloproteinase domain-containing protein 10-like isoform X1 [Branchiostoma floridae]|uniref:ADAM10 endopeptidase n=2 Tax=Branchiostoma floridae TaxID=7739 RepID=A0A9J7ML04_BRAFL|nr:disintegrin and metalloproteinase domain-containing protein 10-like isoform X1 [Branchiostoma floridae]
MPAWRRLVNCYCILSTISVGIGISIDDYVRHYEPVTYNTTDVHGQVLALKENNDSPENNDVAPVRLDFFAFDRHFKLRLLPGANVLEHGVIANIYSSSGVSSKTVNKDILFKGNIEDETESVVHGHIHRGMFSGVVKVTNRTFQVEPAERYQSSRDSPSSRDFHSVMYDHDDVINGSRYDVNVSMNFAFVDHVTRLHTEVITLQPEVFDPQLSHFEDDRDRNFTGPRRKVSVWTKSRSGRSLEPQMTTCTVHVVADHRFYRVIAGSDAVKAIAEMVLHMEEADRIFRQTDFDEDGNGDNVGFSITAISLYTDEESMGYNLGGHYRKAEDYLGDFSRNDFNDFCLAIAFTYQDFSGVLGLAWLGSSLRRVPGGICQRRVLVMSDWKERSFNTAMVTFDRHGSQMSRAVTIISVVHEFGHGFGSPHDPEECRPGGAQGNYVMYPYATDGRKPNNDDFSVCSKQSMRPVMAIKGIRCFEVHEGPFCGNGILEEGEECDCGTAAECAVLDSCCTPPGGVGFDPQCTFKRHEGKVCSPLLFPCCDAACHVVPHQNRTCAEATECSEHAVCTGDSLFCPPPHHLPNGTLCSDGSRVCHGGACVESVCSHLGLEECFCEGSVQEMCYVCCQTEDGHCVSSVSLGLGDPSGTHLVRGPGSICNDYKGYCTQDGRCVRVDSEGLLNRLNNMFSTDGRGSVGWWLRNYWYYGVLAIAGFALVVGILRAALKRRIADTARDQQANRLQALTVEAHRQIKLLDEKLRELETDHDNDVTPGETLSLSPELTHAVSRMSALFPTTKRSLLLESIMGCDDEETTVRNLLALGHPMRSQTGVTSQRAIMENGTIVKSVNC